MILQALVELYEDLADQGKIARPGWYPAKISYALCIDSQGKLTDVVSLQNEDDKGRLQPRIMELPEAVKRTSGIKANFLWDNPSYLLGLDKENPERSRNCYEAAKQLHHRILDNVDSPMARAILAFFDQWNPDEAEQSPVFTSSVSMEDLFKGGNLLFRIDSSYAHEDPAIRTAWQDYYDSREEGGVVMPCLVTGKQAHVEPVHPAIHGVRDAQSSGAALVSFNAPAFCSYGREQNLNAPLSRYAAFAYTSALNWLLADREHVQTVGDTTMVCWAKGADPAYQAFSLAMLFGAPVPQQLKDSDLRAALKRLAEGLPIEELHLDPARPFYVLGLSPNAARISVRFFLRSNFGTVMKNINAHHEAMRIAGPDWAQDKITPLWLMLRETVNQHSKDKKPSPVLAGAVTRSVLTGTLYPTALLEAVMMRIRSESNISQCKAGILKAYFTRNQHPDCPEEVLKVSLNENSTNIPYTLGRLFSVYEDIQSKANFGINSTIKDKYFNAAASTPAVIFPLLNNLCQKHLRKLSVGQRIYYEKQIQQLVAVLGEEFPARLTLPQQGAFDLGYYHQTQKRYEKKEDN